MLIWSYVAANFTKNDASHGFFHFGNDDREYEEAYSTIWAISHQLTEDPSDTCSINQFLFGVGGLRCVLVKYFDANRSHIFNVVAPQVGVSRWFLLAATLTTLSGIFSSL